MNFIINISKEVFDFLCGDWRIFLGVCVTILLVKFIVQLTALTFALHFAGIVYIIGISISLIVALNHVISK